jgi:hypothetical protein
MSCKYSLGEKIPLVSLLTGIYKFCWFCGKLTIVQVLEIQNG